MPYKIARIKLTDDLRAICEQMQSSSSAWDIKNEMSDYSVADLERYLKAGHTFIVAYDGKVIAGAALASELLHPDGKNMLYIHELDVAVAYRRKGLGTVIMNELFNIAKERSLGEVWLGTEIDNEPANHLYKKLLPYEIVKTVIYAYNVKK
jgi:ribosomal protein S18 acetylase RimI-like enzyme